MNDIVFNIVIPASVGALSGGGIFLFLSKKWVSNWFEKDLKKYQNKLDILKIKDEIKFDVSHREMVNRLSRMLHSIAELLKDLNSLTTDIMTKKDKDAIKESYLKVGQKEIELQTGLIESCIFFPENIESGFDSILSLFNESLIDLVQLNDKIENEDRLKRIIIINEYKDRFDKKYLELLHSLRDDIKSLLGVSIFVEENN